MKLLSKTTAFAAISAIALLAVVPAQAPAGAACNVQGQTLINNLKGAWRGAGTVKPIGGAEERIACRVRYVTSGGPRRPEDFLRRNRLQIRCRS